MSTPSQAALAALKRAKPFLSRHAELAVLVRHCASAKTDGRATAGATREQHHAEMALVFEILWDAGFKTRPANIERRHIEVVRRRWLADHRAGRLAVSTLHKKAAILRRFCRDALDKPEDFVPPVAKWFPEISEASRPGAKVEDKSWEAAGVDFEQVYAQVLRMEPFVAWALLAQAAFGLRRREAICLAPHAALRNSAGVPVGIFIEQGAKGGRRRHVVLDTAEARAAIETMAAAVRERDGGAGGTIGPQGLGLTLAGNIRRYEYVLEQTGITRGGRGVVGHGLRAQWAMRFLERHGAPVSVRAGGQDGQGAAMPLAEQRAIRRAASVQLGHSKPEKLAYYAGALPKKPVPR